MQGGTLDGPELLTGRGVALVAFGIEASLVTALAGVLVVVYLVRRAYHEGNFVAPLWRSEERGIATGGILRELR